MTSHITAVLTAPLLAALTLIPAAAVRASIITLADNTGDAEFNTAFTTNTDWQAQAFTTKVTAYTITDVSGRTGHAPRPEPFPPRRDRSKRPGRGCKPRPARARPASFFT